MVERGIRNANGIETRLLNGHGSKWKWKCYRLKERSQEMEWKN